jgi:regulator of replication initiation timing
MQQLNQLKARLRAGVNVGKWRARVLKSGYDRSTRVGEHRQAIAALGRLTWEQHIEHPAYAELFAQLRDLEQQRNATQTHIASLETTIQQEETRKRQLTAEFSARRREAEQPDHAAAPHAQPAEEQPDTEILTQSPTEFARQSALPDNPYATKRLDITDIPATAATEPAVPAPGDMQTIQAEQQQSPARSDDMLADLRQEMQRKRNRLVDLERQFSALQQSLGEAVNRVRPQHDSLVEHYARLDTLDQEIGHLSDEIDTLNQQITAAGTGATKTLYWLAGGAAVALVALLLLVSNGLSISGGGGGVSERQIRADLVGQTLFTPFIWIDLAWNVAEGDIQSLDVLERKTDRNAGTEHIRVQMDLADDMLTVSALVELDYKQYEQGWRLEDMHVPDWEWQLAIIRNAHEPSLNRMGNDIKRVMHERVFQGCNHPVNLRQSRAYGSPSYNGAYEAWYQLAGSACDIRGTWLLHYLWDGNDWEIDEVHCTEGDSSYCG